ncbi:DUF4253 domain-containing protein [Kitasatospora sp. NPDC057542]|uniref:DUF4253 domain-containing protein n=1 Tax=Kitasatospora sp. NPDC057542 TaxID=3346162 RepID=UPI0036778C15
MNQFHPLSEQAMTERLQTEVHSATVGDAVTVLEIRVPAAKAYETWLHHRREHPRTGWYPFVSPWGPMTFVAREAIGGPWSGGGPKSLAHALAQDPEEVVQEMVSLIRGWVLANWKGPPLALPFDMFEDTLAEHLAEHPEADRETRPCRFHSGSGSVAICFVRARHGYEVPALLPKAFETPNWNFSPDDDDHHEVLPAWHVAVLRSWNERFGAELYYAGRSRLEVLVARPPADRRAAARVAIEQFAYDFDGVQDPDIAGDGQVRSAVWSFWWD